MNLTDSNFKWMKFFFAFQIFSIWLEFPDKLLKCVKGLWNIPTLPAMFVVKTSAMTGSAHQPSSLCSRGHANPFKRALILICKWAPYYSPAAWGQWLILRSLDNISEI